MHLHNQKRKFRNKCGVTARRGKPWILRMAQDDGPRIPHRKKRKGPSRIFLKGPVNPAATYSPGPEGQVPSAI